MSFFFWLFSVQCVVYVCAYTWIGYLCMIYEIVYKLQLRRSKINFEFYNYCGTPSISIVKKFCSGTSCSCWVWDWSQIVGCCKGGGGGPMPNPELVLEGLPWPLQGCCCCWWFVVCMNPVEVFWWLNCGGGGDIMGLNEFRVCWLDLGDNDEVANGDVAILSEVDKLENMFNASGKFGGVAGVFAGVISCKKPQKLAELLLTYSNMYLCNYDNCLQKIQHHFC